MRTLSSILGGTFALCLFACNGQQQQQQEDSTTKRQPVPTVAEQPATNEKLIGKWVQPIPGQEPNMQGIQLNQDGSAGSINMHTLLYDKWELKGDTLILWNHTTGVKAAGASIDTNIVKQLTDSTLVLMRMDGLELNYTREQ